MNEVWLCFWGRPAISFTSIDVSRGFIKVLADLVPGEIDIVNASEESLCVKFKNVTGSALLDEIEIQANGHGFKLSQAIIKPQEK